MRVCRALDSLFSTLKTYGSTYPVEFWDTVCQELLFPIFAVLKSSQDLSRFSTQEDMSVWLSTTMIEALRKFIDLYTVYFKTLQKFWDSVLDLLCVCICQGTTSFSKWSLTFSQGLYRERYIGSYRNLLPAATPREECSTTRLFTMGACRKDVCELVQDDNTLPAL